MAELARSFGPQVAVVFVVALVALGAAWRARGSRPGPLGVHLPAAWLTLGALACIGVGTLTRRGDARRPGPVQLDPLATIKDYYWDNDPSQTAAYLVGNILLFVPLGFFLYFAWRRGIVLTALSTAVVSLGVEVLQLPIWSRSTDVDDLILNTIGGTAGAVAAAVLALVAGRRLPRLLVPRADDVPAAPSPLHA